MSPSDLPWWGWLLCAVPFYAVGVFMGWQYEGESYMQSPSERNLMLFKALWYGFWILALFCALVGVVRLVKWAWIG